MNFSLFVSCPKGLEYLLEQELKDLDLSVQKVSPQGVYGEANLKTLYRICLWSRIANRVHLVLFKEDASDSKTIYQHCREFPWGSVFTPDKTLHIEFHGSSAEIRNSMFGAQVIKDGVVDYFRMEKGERPSVDRVSPQVCLQAHLRHDKLSVSLDLTGYSLHQRGYRTESGIAPLKENVAAAMLIRAQWPKFAKMGMALHDPFCGSGTIVIEAAMMAANIAPGLLRHDQLFRHWVHHQENVWTEVIEEAKQERVSFCMPLLGTDMDPRAIQMASDNAARAGVESMVSFNKIEFHSNSAENDVNPSTERGLLICNPPYGERLGDLQKLLPVYQQLGQALHAHYQGWSAAILTSNPTLAKAIGLQSNKQYTLYNGALECKLYCFELEAKNRLYNQESAPLTAGAEMFVNRLTKNFTHLQKWAKRHQIQCYRVYDADLPEYAYAIDIYHDYAVLQEYMAPSTIDPRLVEKRSREVLQSVPKVIGIDPSHLILKERKQQKGLNQYQKMNQSRCFMAVTEGQALLNVNLYDYLDTGLFLDHRLLRLRFAALPKGTRFLNCYCYTATASVHAALAGALTTNIDLSNTYLNWAKENFKLNQLELSKHQFIQQDCLAWLNSSSDRFDVIFLDPPSFSNSKRMQNTLDVQRDHELLIEAAMRRLNSNGVLYFSTNFRSFKLSLQISADYKVVDISAKTIDVDFKRNSRIHHCFMLSTEP